jgi:dihydrodipicolinate synthase/N-acetylneuraminate lyase
MGGKLTLLLVTPFAEDGSLDLESLEREIDWVLAEGASGVACVAIASEGYKLTETERDAVITTTVRRIDGRLLEKPAIDRARRAAASGQLLPSSQTHLTPASY